MKNNRTLKLKRSTSVVLCQGKFIRFINKNGWEYVERANCTGIVIIVALTAEKKVLFVEQFRPPVGKMVIEFPAGLVNDKNLVQKETVGVAAKRELWEETGYQAKKVVSIMRGPVSAGLTSDCVDVVYATGLIKTGSGGGDGTEDLKVHEVVLSKVEPWLKKMERSGRLIEPKIYSGLYFLNKYN